MVIILKVIFLAYQRNLGFIVFMLLIFNEEADTVSIKKLLYIGESQDINDRIENHEKWKKWKK